MKTDFFTRILLTTIAVSLVWIALGVRLAIPAATAAGTLDQESVSVVIKGIGPGIIRPFPVEITDDVQVSCE